MKNIIILTLFPELFIALSDYSIIKQAIKKKKIKLITVNLRDFTKDKHKTVDDKQCGGGPGMILKPDIIDTALYKLKQKYKTKLHILLLDPRGQKYTQNKAVELTKYQNIIIICGHYGGIDERVNKLVDQKISIGEYILTGGELPAMILADSIVRLIPGVINYKSLTNETYSKNNFIQYPQYTKPIDFKPISIKSKINFSVPKILLSGNHQKISQWRTKKTIKK